MASLVRQPFAPLDNARLQNLTSIKNRQNALSTSPPTKRKAADVLDPADFENLDPSLFKRSKGDKPPAKGLSSFFPNKEIYKSAIVLTEKPSTTLNAPVSTPLSPLKSVTSPRRQILNPKSPSKLGSVFAKSSPLTTPAGRSPPRSKRAGILGSSRRRSSTYSRIDPPKYGSPTPFSLDAALKGTIPSYAARASSSLATAASISAGSVSKASSKFTSLDEPAMKGEWFFDIHEDTPEQEMTNMLQHSTCTLDISSDEESEQKQRREHDEGRDKENIPPPDDVSQTRRRLADSAEAVDENAMIVEKIVARQALADLDASDYWAEGCDSESVFVVPGDEDAETVIDENEVLPHLDEQPRNFEYSQRESVSATYLEPIVEVNSSFESKLDEPVAIFEDQSIPQSEQLDIPPPLDQIIDAQPTVEELMMGPFQQKPAAVLEPVEGTTAGESFEVWESGSAKDENEPPCPVEVEVQA